MWNVWCQSKEKASEMKHCKGEDKKLYSAHKAIAPKSTLKTWEDNCQLNQRKVSVKCKQSLFYHEADLLSSSFFTDSADVMTTCFKAERLFWKTSVRACIASGKQQHTTAQYKLSMSSKRQVWWHDFSSCKSFMLQVCNETDTQLIISKYKKNIMKKKKELHTEVKR